jgi:hypothetical protein
MVLSIATFVLPGGQDISHLLSLLQEPIGGRRAQERGPCQLPFFAAFTPLGRGGSF